MVRRIGGLKAINAELGWFMMILSIYTKKEAIACFVCRKTSSRLWTNISSVVFNACHNSEAAK